MNITCAIVFVCCLSNEPGYVISVPFLEFDNVQEIHTHTVLGQHPTGVLR